MKKLNALEKQVEAETNYSGRSSGDGAEKGTMSSIERTLIARKKAKAMAIATAPGKQIMMNGFMMYMSGKSLNLFSISITSMALLSPLKAIFNMGIAFKPFEDPDGKVDLQTAKLAYVALNLLWLIVGLYKMSNMRLLPTTSADWSGSVVWKEMLEGSNIPASW
uniref:ER membrane protein complex subunit 4 n=2 Tax=Proboscia inermis TaxID=420281 RepID=A0A7S0GI69_9STRA|mmetsp:Transcript_3762/g.3875  ORF Transcript_3762/g.3875 Transcript_3762/m.3875 type:complete len:164 (+) Transcript_3762:511-1002(+)